MSNLQNHPLPSTSVLQAPTSMPTGYRSPLALIDSDHHGGWILIANCMCLATGILALLSRIYIRTRISPPLRSDDITLAVATVMASVQSALVFVMIRFGYGTAKHLLSKSDVMNQGKLRYAANIFYIAGIYLSKICLVLFYRRIAANKKHDVVARIVFGSCVICGIASLFLISIHCPVSHPWSMFESQCNRDGFTIQWAVVVAFNVLTEVMLFGESIMLAAGLKANLYRKIYVIFPFSLRLPLIAITILRMYYLDKQIHSKDASFSGAVTNVLMQLELFYSITAATIPCLRPFLVGFTTNYGAIGERTVIGGSQVGNSSGDRRALRDMQESKGACAIHTDSHFAYVDENATINGTIDNEPEQEWYTPGRGFHQDPLAITPTRGQRHDWLGSSDASDTVIWNHVYWNESRDDEYEDSASAGMAV